MEKKFYLTKEGLKRLQKELETLKKLRLSRIKGEESTRVLESEDISPEYLSFREDLSFLETRIADLDYILKRVEMVKPPCKEERGVVGLGATVTLKGEDGQINEFILLGTLEANPMQGRISDESPIGKALLGKKIGETILISSPIHVVYRITKIRYETS